MLITCSHCHRKTHEGKHCEKCGEPLSATEIKAEPKVEVKTDAKTDASFNPYGGATEKMTERFDADNGRWERLDRMIREKTEIPEVRIPPQGSRSAKVELWIDRLSVLLGDMSGTVRFQLNPPAGETLANVRIALKHDVYGQNAKSLGMVAGKREFPINFPQLAAGSYAWDVELEYDRHGVKCQAETSVEILVMRRENAPAIADKLVFNIHNDIKAEGAADVRVSNRIADELGTCLKRGDDPFALLQRCVTGPDRAWCRLPLQGWARINLPPMPEMAKTEGVTLDSGFRKLHLFAGRSAMVGHNRGCHIVLRPFDIHNEEASRPYRKMSRWHCTLEHEGDKALVHDGCRDENRMFRRSTNGTFWNDQEIGANRALAAGDEGTLSFGGPSCADVVSVDVKALSPSKLCTKCPFSDRGWCGRGRPSLLLTRRDDMPEKIVALWSCLDIGDVYPAFRGVVVFRKDDAFAWADDINCGWLVPGERIETEYGFLNVTQLEKPKPKEV